MAWFSRKPVVPVIRFSGAIGMATPMRPGLSLNTVATALSRAFTLSRLPSVAISINSPGGSPVQSNLIFRRIRQLAKEHDKRVYVFCEDVAASGGYFLALAGDEIYADPSSIVGSIGVISASFGFDQAISRLGIERRVHTSGAEKSFLDPFMPEKDDAVARLKAVQREIHDAFIAVVKERRAGKLKTPDSELFSGAFWSGPRAHELGLIDGIADMRSHMQSLHGEKVQLKVVPLTRGGLLSRMMRTSLGNGIAAPTEVALMLGSTTFADVERTDASNLAPSLTDDIIATLETRALWARFGL